MKANFSRALWQIYNRPERPLPFAYGGNLPWDEAEFSKRMLRYHLSEKDNAASRVSAEREKQLNFIHQHLNLQAAQTMFDITCGPGLYALELAKKGINVVGVDFATVSIDYANELVSKAGLAGKCTFDVADIRSMDYADRNFDAAMLIYGQLAVMTSDEAQDVLQRTAASLKSGGKLLLELLNPDKVDKKDSTWWFTDDARLWGDAPYLHLGERMWDDEAQLSTERFQILHLDSGQLDEIILCDQVYAPETVVSMLELAGFGKISIHPAWDKIDLYDEDEWIVYVAEKR